MISETQRQRTQFTRASVRKNLRLLKDVEPKIRKDGRPMDNYNVQLNQQLRKYTAEKVSGLTTTAGATRQMHHNVTPVLVSNTIAPAAPTRRSEVAHLLATKLTDVCIVLLT